jgi:ABC-type transport system involved in multi-copper enzyme maturation permease subunit
MRSALVLAHLTLVRLMRGRAVWVSAIIALLPVAFAAAVRANGNPNVAMDVLAFEMLMLAIIPPMFVASSIGEDIEDRTTTYLWSRPVPRWSVLAGKLIALAPLASLLITASWLVAVYVGEHHLPSAQTTVALFAGALAISLVSSGLGTLLPKHGMAMTIAYMLFFDLPVGAMPISLAKLSVTHHARAIAGAIASDQDTTATEGAIGLAVLGGLWLAVAVWRMRRLEA